jgi:hypothetical protein
VLIISSVMPSLKYSLSLSGLIFTKGNTAMLCLEIISIFKNYTSETVIVVTVTNV